MLTVYHASNQAILKPAIIQGRKSLDFGTGFYTTSSYEQACRFASNVVKKRGGRPFLNSYAFDDALALKKCSVLSFETADDNWLDFVAANRRNDYSGPKYDIIRGPVANDGVYPMLELYLRGNFNREAAIWFLKTSNLHDQIVFCSCKALGFVKHVNTEEL